MLVYSLIAYYMVSHCFFFFFKQKTAYEMRISDWSSDVCSSDLKLYHGSPGQAHCCPVKHRQARAGLGRVAFEVAVVAHRRRRRAIVWRRAYSASVGRTPAVPGWRCG